MSSILCYTLSLKKIALQWCETRRECNRLRLVDILVKPMQRLTKYSLLLKAVLKNTDSEDQCTSLARMVCLYLYYWHVAIRMFNILILQMKKYFKIIIIK